MWESFGHLKWDPRHRSGILVDDEFSYNAPLTPVKEEEEDERRRETAPRTTSATWRTSRRRPRRRARWRSSPSCRKA
jgi:hypothetical protein